MLKSLLRSRHSLQRAPFIVCDTDGYRLGQERKVCGIAEQKADFVRRTGSRVALPAMSPYFRRIVHTHIVTSEHLQDLTTDSAGEGDHRHPSAVHPIREWSAEKASDQPADADRGDHRRGRDRFDPEALRELAAVHERHEHDEERQRVHPEDQPVGGGSDGF